jgi:hypothetical protein
MGKNREPSGSEYVRHFGPHFRGDDLRKHIAHLIDLATKLRPGAKHPNSPRSARELCRLAANCLEFGWEMPDELQEYIVWMLRHVEAGGSADKALGLNRKPRLDALDQEERNQWLADCVDNLRAMGKTKTDAMEFVAREYLGTDDITNLKRICRHYRTSDKGD